MVTIALVISMLAATVACVAIGERIHVPYPILMLVVSMGIAFIPGLPHIQPDPEIILPLFLPPLLFAAAQHTSWGVFRSRWRSLLVLAFGLTTVTAFAVAGTAWALIPGIGFPLALMLGAMVSPPDPVAVEVVSEPARMPRRLVSILQTEGLFNDAVAIVLFQGALQAVSAGHALDAWLVAQFLLGAILAVGVGFVVGWLFRIGDKVVTTLAARVALGVVAPFAAYMLAEELHASGVIAVVVTALETKRNARAQDGELRMTRTSFWNVANLLVTGLAFGLIGVELRDVVADEGSHLFTYMGVAVIVSVVVIVVRFVGMLVLGQVTRGGLRVPESWRETLVLTWCGMRGLATLALALAIPLQDAQGHPIADRNLLIVIACTVLVITLVPTGVLLPWLLRVLHLQDDGSATFEQMRMLGERAQQAALASIQERMPDLELPEAEKKALISRLKHLQFELSPAPTATAEIRAISDDPKWAGSDDDDDPQAAQLRRAKMRAARDIALTAQTVALDAARAEVLAARGEPGVDPAAADKVLTRLDRRMMAVPPRVRQGHGSRAAKGGGHGGGKGGSNRARGGSGGRSGGGSGRGR